VRKKYASKSEVAEYVNWLYGDTPNTWVIENIGTMVRASIELLLMVGEHRAAHPEPIIVERAPTERQFIRNAVIAFRKANESISKRGRTSEENVCMARLMALSHELGRDPTHAEMITRLMKCKVGILKVSKNTAHKYARLYRLWLQEPQGLSKTDLNWLRRNFGVGACSVLWLGFRARQWISDRRSSRLRKRIEQVYMMQLRRQRQVLEKHRLNLLRN
jgi:hypothetical protein